MRKKHGLGVKVGGRLRVLRRRASLTQRALALKARINLKYVGEIELGNRDVRLATLERLAKALDVEPRDLLTFTEADVTISRMTELLKNKDEAFRAHLLRLVNEFLLLAETAK